MVILQRLPIRSWLTRWLTLSCGMLACLGKAEVAPGQESEVRYPDKQNVMLVANAGGKLVPVQSKEDWALRRRHILADMQRVMGPLPGDERRVPLDPQITAAHELPFGKRLHLTLAVEPGDRLPAILFLPKSNGSPAPAMLCCHQTTSPGKEEPAGLAGLENLHYAEELAKRGYVTLAVDYPNFGDYSFDSYAHGYDSATMKGIWNHMRAVDYLQSLPEVDDDRIGVIGHSLGGHNSIFVAALDERLKCVVSSCGFCSFFRYYGGDLTGWSHAGYMPRIADMYHCDPAQMPFDFTEVVAALAPRAFFACAPTRDSNFDLQGVKDCLTAAQPVYALFGAEENLVGDYPEAEHDFPPESRERAYQFIDRALKKDS